MGEINITSANIDNIEPLQIDRVSNIAPLTIAKVAEIAPVAVHLKEVNHIDPLSIDSLNVSEVRNIDPIRIQEFNVTRLPTVNLSVRQLPPVDFNVRRMPPLSVGVSQDFSLPSNYTVRARLLGFEVLRVNVDGRTAILPEERARREQVRTHERSFPEVAAAGNPAIPSKAVETRAYRLPSCAPCFPLPPGGAERSEVGFKGPFGFSASASGESSVADPSFSSVKS